MNSIMLQFDKICDTVSRRIAAWSTRRFLLTIIIVQTVLHIPTASLPPMGQHTWRQVMGLSVARNYFDENNAFLNSAQDIRVGKEDRGIIYTEFPLIYWVLGQSYHLTGFSHANGRILALGFGLLLLLGGYRLVRLLGYEEIKARWFVFFLGFSPYFFYYAISFLPNLPALAMFVWGINLIIPGLQKEKWNISFFMGLVLVIISTATKLIYLFYGLPIAYLFLRQYLKSRRPFVLLIAGVSGAAILLSNYYLFEHGRFLMAEAPIERRSTIMLHYDPLLTDWSIIFSTLRWTVNEWFLQMYVNTAAIPIFFVGCYLAIKRKGWRSDLGKFWSIWLLSFLIFTFFFFPHFRDHGYYLTSISLIAALGSSYGVGPFLKHRKWKRFVLVLLVMVPLVMVGRVSHRWGSAKQVPDTLLYHTDEIQQSIPKDEQVLVIGDSSPVIFLYFLHRKGIVIDKDISEEKLSYYLDKGFRYIVSNISPDHIPVLLKKKYQQMGQVDKFVVLRLIENKK